MRQVGFFCTAGPLKVFVSTHLIPEDFTYDTADEPAFVSEDDQVRITAGSEVRVRLVGVRLDANECVCPLWQHCLRQCLLACLAAVACPCSAAQLLRCKHCALPGIA